MSNEPRDPEESPDEANESPSLDGVVEDENADQQAEPSEEQAKAMEDDPAEAGSAFIAPEEAESEESPYDNTERASRAADSDDESDIGTIAGDAAPSKPPDSVDWADQASVNDLALELRAVEKKVRSLLEDRDTRRKRKLAGSRRWLELEDDILNLRFSGRVPEDMLRELQVLVQRRHYLFHRLRFLTTTRPTWNS